MIVRIINLIRKALNWVPIIFNTPNMTPDSTVNWINLTPQSGNYLFGYYDRDPWDDNKQRHLCIRFTNQFRLPQAGERATVGFIERKKRTFHPIWKTEAWCHQQGAMQQWLPNRPGEFIFNDFRFEGDKTWSLISRVFSVDGEHIRDYEDPVFILSRDGKWAASINFHRIPRRGYTYARCTPASQMNKADLENDGLFLMDMESGKCSLIVPFKRFVDIFPDELNLEKDYIWLNHAGFNSDNTRLLVLFRTSRNIDASTPSWTTYLYTMNLDGGDLNCPLPHRYWKNWRISHHLWGRSPHEILIDANVGKNGQNYCVFDSRKKNLKVKDVTVVSGGLKVNGHPSFSSDGKWVVSDTYPSFIFAQQRVCLCHVETGKAEQIGRFYHIRGRPVDVRCDLHPRWSKDGSLVTIDTINYGDRNILMANTDFPKRELLHTKVC